MLGFLVLGSVVLAQCKSIPINEVFVEWRKLSDVEKLQYVEGVKCLAKKPSIIKGDFSQRAPEFGPWGFHPQPKSRLDDLTYCRARTIYSVMQTTLFLPWHRVYLRLFDAALRECGYNGRLPYWDLAIDANALANSDVFNYFGKMQSVRSINLGLEPPILPHFPRNPLNVGIPIQGSVLRGLMPTKHAKAFAGIFSVMRETTYERFTGRLENALGLLLQHSEGDLSHSLFSSNDPLFFLLQRYVDRLWYFWQLNNPKAGPSIDVSMMFVGLRATGFTVKEVLNPSGGGAGGLMCYGYSRV